MQPCIMQASMKVSFRAGALIYGEQGVAALEAAAKVCGGQCVMVWGHVLLGKASLV